MQPSTPPKATHVEVVPTQPTDADRAAIAHLSAQERKPLPDVTYLVKVRLESIPPATSHGWALYVKDIRIPKYWEYKDGIYFKVFDPQFFRDHKEHSLRWSLNETEFVDTGLKLPAPHDVERGEHESTELPRQDDVLNSRGGRP